MKLETAFEFFDKRGRGKIDKDDLKFAIGSKRQSVNESVYLSIIEEVDEDKDGAINFQEFKKMFMDLQKS
jgi:Ca2+-binding EF-hand superfamily protein